MYSKDGFKINQLEVFFPFLLIPKKEEGEKDWVQIILDEEKEKSSNLLNFLKSLIPFENF